MSGRPNLTPRVPSYPAPPAPPEPVRNHCCSCRCGEYRRVQQAVSLTSDLDYDGLLERLQAAAVRSGDIDAVETLIAFRREVVRCLR